MPLNSDIKFLMKFRNNTSYWAAEQQTSWVIAPWWFSVSPWRICITFVWPRGSLKLTAPSSQSERHLHFASIRLYPALLFIISMQLSKGFCPIYCERNSHVSRYFGDGNKLKKNNLTLRIHSYQVERCTFLRHWK